MQQIEVMDRAARAETDSQRVDAVVESICTLGGRGETVAEVAHDARNLVTALGLYCELLEEPGVLAVPFIHYGNELRLVAAASRRLVEKLIVYQERQQERQTGGFAPSGGERTVSPSWGVEPLAGMETGRRDAGQAGGAYNEMLPAPLISNLAAELLAIRNLLAALAGPGIALTVDVAGSARPVRLTAEDLTRILVNLVRNAAEVMPSGGCIRIGLSERPAQAGENTRLVLVFEDNGPGIPPGALERIFESGFSTRPGRASGVRWTTAHRGLGLVIVRSIVEAAGGSIQAANREPCGARFLIELPTPTAGR